jgi:uncharacterized membrane protein YdjX (TVP38/TMEM64 family)
MSSAESDPKRAFPGVKLAVVAVVLLAGAALLLRGVDPRALIERGLAMVRDAGPAAFFVAMALLPAAGVPILAFSLTAGPAFAGRIGMGWVVVFALLAVTANFTLTYFLARRALRPLLEKLVVRLGYKLPQVAAGDATDLAILVRVTPGIPLSVQNYLLGLADVPFGKYFAVSAAVTWVYQTAFVLFGEALLHGRGKVAMIAGSLLIAAVTATHLVRKHYGKKKADAA